MQFDDTVCLLLAFARLTGIAMLNRLGFNAVAVA
jgi:hypothetical protein